MGCLEAYLDQKLMHQINTIHSGEVSSFHFKFYRKSKDINSRISTSNFNTTVPSIDQHTDESCVECFEVYLDQNLMHQIPGTALIAHVNFNENLRF